MDTIVEVLVGLPIDKTFHYSVPDHLRNKISVGKRIWIPFGTKRLVGYIVGTKKYTDITNLKDIDDVIDQIPIIDETMLRLTKWISDYYFCSWGEALENALPTLIRKGRTDIRRRKKITEHLIPSSQALQLTSEQKNAYKEIADSISKRIPRVFLLFGITASGKTELYLQLIELCLRLGLSNITLVPEISLTPQTTERFKARFGQEVSVIHSRISEGERFETWQKIRMQKSRVVVGVRSAIFSPVKNLGLIIIDEEHETSYKQQDPPRYHARDVALKLGELTNSVVVLGSATPSIESFYKAIKGEYSLLKLTRRVTKRQLPPVKIIDMRKELSLRRRVTIISLYLKEKLKMVLAERKQAMLFLNRRGFSTQIGCKRCGFVSKCKRCESILVYHSDIKKLICHYCNRRYDIPKVCPECESAYIKYYGMGTQKVESELHRLFPDARISRMDTDATVKRHSYERILNEFKKGDTDILVGTQMIAKGLDFPRVDLVGVILADISLNIPDFRATERTFDLLTQVAGRAGRGEGASTVVIQTYVPQHYAIQTASRYDYETFFTKELDSRKLLQFPPYSQIIKLTFRASKEQKAKDSAFEFITNVRRLRYIKILGPAPSPIIKIRGQYRWNVLLKVKSSKANINKLREIILEYKTHKTRAFMFVDVDPMQII